VNSYRGYRLPVASGWIVASIVSFNSSIEIGFCSTECPRKSDGSQRVPGSGPAARIGAIAMFRHQALEPHVAGRAE
jgi:hypothetical protein